MHNGGCCSLLAYPPIPAQPLCQSADNHRMDGTATRLQTIRLTHAVQPLADLLEAGVRVETQGLRHRADWDRFVRDHPAGTPFHLTAWTDAVDAVFPYQVRNLAAFRGDRLVGVLPVSVVRSRLGGVMLVSVPYAVAGGMLVGEEAARAALWKAALDLAEEVGAATIDLRCERIAAGSPRDTEADGWFGTVTATHVKFERVLPDRAEDVLVMLPRKARAAARNGETKHGLTADFGSAHLRTVWRLYCRSMRRLGSISYPLEFFEQLVVRFNRDAHVQIVRRGGEAVAGLVSFRFGEVFLPYFAGCDERFNHCQTNNVLYLTAMRRAVELGCRVFDFGRTRVDNRGSFDFKRFHGFEPTPLAYERWTRAGARPVELSAGSAKFAWARRIWPRLPQAVCVRLSGLLAPHIPG